MLTKNMKTRIIYYLLTIGASYLFRAIDFSPFETNFNFTLWENGKLFRWLGLSLFLIIIEEVQISIKAKKELKVD